LQGNRQPITRLAILISTTNCQRNDGR